MASSVPALRLCSPRMPRTADERLALYTTPRTKDGALYSARTHREQLSETGAELAKALATAAELAEAVVFCECPGQQANEEHNRGLGLRLQQMAQDGALAVAEAGWPPSLPLSAEVRRRAADIIAAIVGASARHAEQQALAEQQAALQAAGVF